MSTVVDEEVGVLAIEKAHLSPIASHIVQHNRPSANAQKSFCKGYVLQEPRLEESGGRSGHISYGGENIIIPQEVALGLGTAIPPGNGTLRAPVYLHAISQAAGERSSVWLAMDLPTNVFGSMPESQMSAGFALAG